MDNYIIIRHDLSRWGKESREIWQTVLKMTEVWQKSCEMLLHWDMLYAIISEIYQIQSRKEFGNEENNDNYSFAIHFAFFLRHCDTDGDDCGHGHKYDCGRHGNGE